MFFQTKNNVPNVYTNESRDFNIFEQIYDLAFNSCLFYTNKINYIKSVSKIDASLLPKLATYLGFITSVHYPEKILRSILINYPDIIRNKGTKKAIRLAVLSLQNAFTGITYLDVFINNDKAESNYRVVEIVTDGVVIDRLYIEDLLKHILPIGYVFGWIKVASPYNIYSAYRQQDLVVSVKFNDNGTNGYKVRQTPTDVIQGSGESDLSINTKNYLYNLIGHTKIAQTATTETDKDFSELYTNFSPNDNSTETEGE